MKFNPLILIVIGSLILSLLFASGIPLTSPNILFQGLNPDETDHLSYVQKLAETKVLVTFTVGPDGHAAPGFAETHQPPLYYLLCVPFFLLSGGNLTMVRLVATLLQLATVVVFWRAGRDLFPDRREVAPLIAAIAAFLPATAQLSGAVNNDSLTTLLCAAIFWRLGLLVTQGQTAKESAILGLLIGAGLWTKLTVLQLLPVVVVAYALAARRLGGVSQALKLCSVAIGLGFLVATPWLARNTVLYGDPFNLKIFPQTAPASTPTPEKMMALRHWTFFEYLWNDSVRSFTTFFALIPPNVLGAKPPLVLLFAALAVIGLVGSIAMARTESARRPLIVLAVVAICVLVPFFLAFNLRFFQAQGRYFHAVLLPVALLIALGLTQWVPNSRRGLVAALVGALLFVLALLQAISLCQAFL